MLATREALSTVEAAAAADISFRQIDHWIRLGIVEPSIASATGSGSRRRFSFEDTRLLAALAAACSLGCQISGLTALARELALLDAWSGPLFISPAGDTGHARCSLRGAPAGIVLDLGVISDNLEQRLR